MKTSRNKPAIKSEDKSIVQILSTYVPYWPLFLIFFIISISAALLYLRYTTPKYEASATIIIKDEKKGYDDSKLLESINMINTKKIVENEIEVLQSRTLMTEVVKKLHLYAPIVQEGKVHSLSAYITSPISIEASNPDTIKQNYININLIYDEKKGSVTLNNGYTGSINQWLNTPYGKLKFTQNERYWQGDKKKLLFFSLFPPKSVAGYMSQDLKVAASSKLSSVVVLSYVNEIPQLAEDVLNELVISYGKAALQDKNNLARNTLKFIQERLGVVKNDLDSIERKLQQYKSGKGAVDISRQGQLYLENISSNDKRLSDLALQGAVLGQLEKAATAPGNLGLLSSTLGINDPALIQQMNTLNGLQQQYDKLKPTVAENNPLLLSVTEQINRIKPSIISNIQSQRQSLEQSKNNLYATGGIYSSSLNTIPQKEKELIEISRDQNIKNGIYSFLLQKREESELSFVSTLSDSKVVNYAQSSGIPVSPKKLIIFIMAIAFSFGFPVILITVKEGLSPKILYRREIESLTNIPIIGEIGYSKTKDPLVVASGKRTISAEEFRKVRVSLLSLGIDESHNKILITSSISGEGKSFIAANLATSLSLTGKKVVLLDLDLHNPGLGKVLGINDKLGVSNYLIGEKTLNEIILNIPGNNNLFYISSGTLLEDASELLLNGKVQPLIEKLSLDYDIVLIDTAPIVLITDAYLLSSLCDATLYVIRHKFTPKFLVKRIEENIEVNPIKNLAIIFNGVKTRGFFKNNYGYGYNNYVYGYDNKRKNKNSV